MRNYHCQGFRNIPASCLAFKNDLVAEKNVVAEFLNEAVEPAGPKDFVHVKDLYNDFDEAYRMLQKDKKTKKSLQIFKAGVMKTMPKAYKDRFGFRSADGKCRTMSSVLVGFKRKIPL